MAKNNAGAKHDGAMETRVDANDIDKRPSPDVNRMKPIEEGVGQPFIEIPARVPYTTTNSDSRDD